MGELGNEVFVKGGEGEQVSRKQRTPGSAAGEASVFFWCRGGGRGADTTGGGGRRFFLIVHDVTITEATPAAFIT